MNDFFSSFASSLDSPASYAFEVTPDDLNDLPVASRAVTTASDGIVRLTTIGGNTVNITVLTGVPFPIRCRRIWATGTTATGIVALY